MSAEVEMWNCSEATCTVFFQLHGCDLVENRILALLSVCSIFQMYLTLYDDEYNALHVRFDTTLKSRIEVV
jgi:hypothetical protein